MTSVLAVGRDINDPVVPLTCVDGAATGAMALGTYAYKYTFRTAFGETLASPASAPVVVTKGSVDISNIPVYLKNEVTARRIYRTAVGGVGPFLLLAEITDNVTTTYTDLYNDSALGGAEPIANFASTVERVEGWLRFNRQIGRSQGTVAAAGLTQATATAIGSYEYVYVSVPSNLNGVRLPPINSNMIGVKVTINNMDMFNTLNVYPYEIATAINGGVPAAPLALAPSFSLELICDGASSWRFASSLTAGVAGPPSGAAGGDLTGSYPAPALVTTGVAAATYGSSTLVPVITFDTKGRATFATNVLADKTPGGLVPFGGDLTGSYPAPILTPTGVVAGIYGSGTFSPVISVDSKGRITSATSTLITAVASGPAGGDLAGSYPNPTLTTTGVVAGTYGSASQVPIIAVDSNGRITSAATTLIAAIPGGPAGGDLAGSYPNPTLITTGVAAGTYGAAAQVPVLAVDSKGRITSATTVAIAGGPPSGPAGGSLFGTYPNPTLSNTGVGLGTYTKVTVNLEGRITSGATLVGSDLPLVSGDVTGAYVATVLSAVQGISVRASPADNVLLISGNTVNTGTDNTAYGKDALLVNIAGTRNSAFGSSSLPANTSGNDNSAYGVRSLLVNTTGLRNTAVGKDSLKANISSSDSTGIGFSALGSATGGGNTAVGSSAGSVLTTGTSNVLAGLNSGVSLTTGSNNVAIGNAAGGANLDTGSNNIVIGSGASPSASGVSNEITLGNSSITRVRFGAIGAIPVYANDTAADADATLLAGSIYRTTGNRQLLIKP